MLAQARPRIGGERRQIEMSVRPQIAIVDDDSGFANYLRTYLSMRGYDTHSYARGDQVLAAMEHGQPPDVVLLDVMMPGMNGIDTLRALKAARPDLQAIMVSGRQHASTIVEAVRLGAADYLVKAERPGEAGELALDSAITRALERRRVLSGATLRPASRNDRGDRPIGWDESPAMRTLARMIERVADSDVTVLVRGETGVGKELVARAIHERSTRTERPFVKVNCAALPLDLLERELFGHEKGAFTGAAAARIGKFEEAHRGTIVLDEIGELKPPLQAKLLHVLQDATFTKLGGNQTIKVDVRVVAATNRDLEALLVSGRFREDLYYRLKVIELTVPPLRERRAEIPLLTDYFVAHYAHRYQRPAPAMSNELRERFLHHGWPGNVRELENTIKRFVILRDEQSILRELGRSTHADDSVMVVSVPAGTAVSASPTGRSEDDARRLADVSRDAAMAAERAVIAQTLKQVRWNRRRAAQQLGVSYKTLLKKIKECGITNN